MAAENERRLISALVLSGNLSECTERGMAPDWFTAGSDHKKVYEFCVGHTAKYGEFPTRATVKDNFPAYRFLKTKDPLLYFIDQQVAFLREEVVLSGTGELIKDISAKDTEAAAAKMVEITTDLRGFSPTPVYQTDLTKTGVDRWNEYLAHKATGSALLGMSSGYPTIDKATLGFRPEQLIVLVAVSKAGKSTICLKICQHIHDTYDKTPLLVSFEMSRRELGERHDATRAKVSYKRLQQGSLTGDEEASVQDMHTYMEDAAPFILADASEGTTLDSLQARIHDVKPDLLVVDGVYMMTDSITGESNTPMAITNLTRGLKRMAQSLKIPILISTQALRAKMSRGKINADSAGYSSSFSQDADVMLALEHLEMSDTGRKLRVLLSRNCGPTSIDIDFDYERGEFGEIGAL